MKTNLSVIFLFWLCICSPVLAQQNCNNPLPVTVCPIAYLNNQTNAGMLDDLGSPCGVVGEDIVYEIQVPTGAFMIYAYFTNVTGQGRVSLRTGSCNATSCTSFLLPVGNSSHSFPVLSSNYFYLTVDAATTISFNVAIGADSNVTVTSFPNTTGILAFDSCALNPFGATKKFLEVTYNGVNMFQPMTLSPLFTPGVMCIRVYLKNTTGVLGPRVFRFNFPSGMINVTAVQPIIQGVYRPGTWRSVQSSNVITYTFSDSAGSGHGDFNGPMSCAVYSFCFNMIPVSNSPTNTNVTVLITSDRNGMPYTRYDFNGCCPLPNCRRVSYGVVSGSPAALGFGFDDPGNALPVELLHFSGNASDKDVRLEWSTASEVNNEYFILDRSTDGTEWEHIVNVNGNGTVSTTSHYTYVDNVLPVQPLYYRLSQVDFDGTITRFEPIVVKGRERNTEVVFPNPAHTMVYIKTDAAIKWSVSNVFTGKRTDVSGSLDDELLTLDVSDLPNGIYTLKLEYNHLDPSFHRIVVSH